MVPEQSKFLTRYYLVIPSAILGPMTTNSLIPLFSKLQMTFQLEVIALISVAIFFYIFPFAIFQLFAGTFSDLVDKKKVVVVGFLIFTGGLLLALLSVLIGNFFLFLGAFFVQGIGFSFINPTVLAILSIITPEEREGTIMGLYNSSAGGGVSLGAFISGLLISVGDWRFLFVINPIISLLCLLGFLYGLRNCEQLVCRTYEALQPVDGVVEKAESMIKSTFRQLRENLKPQILLLSSLGFFCFFTVITLTYTINEQMIVNIPNLSTDEVARNVSLILTINGLISITLSPFTGSLLKKYSPLLLLGIGFIFLSIIIIMPLSMSIMMLMMVSFVIYVGSAFIWPSLFKASMDLNPEARGTNSAIINSIRFMGYALVSIVYLFVGIPFIYYMVFSFGLISITIILVLQKRYYQPKKENNKLEH